MSNNQSLDFSDDAINDIVYVVNNQEQVEKVVDYVDFKSKPQTLPEAYSELASITGTVEHAQSITRWLLNILRIRPQYGNDEETIKLIFESLHKQKSNRWFEREIASSDNQQLIRALAKFNERHPLAVLQKASYLTYSHQTIFNNARIMTDIRPVFESGGTKILKTIVLYKLLIDYSDTRGQQTIEMALDAVDVDELRKTCDRADAKVKAIKESLQGISWDVIVPRENAINK